MFSSLSQTFGMAPTNFVLWPQRPFAQHIRLAQLCNDFTSLGFAQVGCLRFHPLPVAYHQIGGSRKRMSKVLTNGSSSKCILKWEITIN